MEKEKKGIRCSYAVLVIILFAALAFVTDYAVIERKTRTCDCPKCETTESTKITENKYLQNYISFPNGSIGMSWGSKEIVLKADGTAEWNYGGSESGLARYSGYYKYIGENKMALALFDYDYLEDGKCDNEVYLCQTSLILEYDETDGTYKSNGITFKEVSKSDLKIVSE